jgi:hypothetical protein
VPTGFSDVFIGFQPVNRGSVAGRTALEGRVVHLPDVLEDPEYTLRDLQYIAGCRAGLGAPLSSAPQQFRLGFSLHASIRHQLPPVVELAA